MPNNLSSILVHIKKAKSLLNASALHSKYEAISLRTSSVGEKSSSPDFTLSLHHPGGILHLMEYNTLPEDVTVSRNIS